MTLFSTRERAEPTKARFRWWKTVRYIFSRYAFISSTYSSTSGQLRATKESWKARSDDFCGSGISESTWLRTSAANCVTSWSSQFIRDRWYKAAKLVARSTSPLFAWTISRKCSSTSAFWARRSAMAFFCLSSSTAISASVHAMRSATCSACRSCGRFSVTEQPARDRVSISCSRLPVMLRRPSAAVASSSMPRFRTSRQNCCRPWATTWRIRGMTAVRNLFAPFASSVELALLDNCTFCSNAKPRAFTVPHQPT
mmetsp:Transcript_87168/g.255138  ORF Transcript_87168/g.255138 Transcript_87168/m.255138 type:complete len:255 (-) Transcript_87168:1237-2001(-)